MDGETVGAPGSWLEEEGAKEGERRGAWFASRLDRIVCQRCT